MSLRVLYAPTWEGFFEDSCYSSLAMGPQIVACLAAFSPPVVLDYKSHPLTGTCRDDYRRYHEEVMDKAAALGIAGVMDAPGRQLYDYFADADVLIADVSSVISDFLYLDRPIIITNPLRYESMASRFPVARGCYVLEPEPFNLDALLRDIVDGDPMAAARAEVREYILGPSSQRAIVSMTRAVDQLVLGADEASPVACFSDIVDRLVSEQAAKPVIGDGTIGTLPEDLSQVFARLASDADQEA